MKSKNYLMNIATFKSLARRKGTARELKNRDCFSSLGTRYTVGRYIYKELKHKNSKLYVLSPISKSLNNALIYEGAEIIEALKFITPSYILYH